MDEDESKFTWLIVLFATIGLALVVTSSLVFNRIDPSRAGTVAIGDNCNILTCPQGQPGPPSIGVPGPPGQRGEKGDRGETGPQGVPGAAGGIGPPGMCLANPACGVGPSGATGPQGPQGLQGAPGFQGAQGNPGQQGPRGETGPIGPSGPIGATGPTGPQGIPGVCDCFNQTVVYNTLNVTSNFHLGDNSIFTCGINSTIANNCLTVGNCPNFTLCDLQARSLFLTGGMPTILRVGNPGEITPRQVIFGDSGSFFNYTMNDIRMYSQNLVIEGTGTGTTVIRTLNQGLMRVEALGGMSSVLNLRSNGEVNLIGEAGLTKITNTVGGGIFLNNQDPAGGIYGESMGFVSFQSSSTGSISLISDFNNLRKANVPILNGSIYYLSTNPSSSYNYQSGIITGTPSVSIHDDLVIVLGQHIVAQDSYLKVGPNLDVGAGRIITNQNVMSLMSGKFENMTYNEYISLEAVVINNAIYPNITYYPPQCGVTALADAGLSDGYVWFNDTNGMRVSSNVYIDGDITVCGTINMDVKWGTAGLTNSTGQIANTTIPLTGFTGTIPNNLTDCFQIDKNGTYSISYKFTGSYNTTSVLEDGIFVRKTAGMVTLVPSRCIPIAIINTTVCEASAQGIVSLVSGDEICLFSGSVARVWEGSVYNYFNIMKL